MDKTVTYILKELKEKRVWFGTASEIVEWFQKRRKTIFEDTQQDGKSIRVVFGDTEKDSYPSMIVRIYRPEMTKSNANALHLYTRKYSEILWNGEKNIEISM